MRVHYLFLYAFIAVFLAQPATALECANAGAAPTTAPDDTDDGDATACGRSAVAGGPTSTALGPFASSAGTTSVALGYQASSPGLSSLALGESTSAIGDYSTAVGYFAYAPGIHGTALGQGAYAIGNFSVALGFRAYADQPDTVILGAIAGVNNATTYANVGIGTSAPTQAVDVERSGAAARFQVTSFTDVAADAPQYIQRRARGTTGAPTALQNNDNLGLFSFRGHNGTTMGGSRATITAQAAGTFSDTSTPTRLIFATTPVGSTTPQSVLTITPDGKVQVKGVNLNVPDYVFEDDYQLMPLDELKTFIDENGHLPGIASAAQVNEEGLDLAGSQMSQLQKIEELTLYALQQEQRLKELQVKADKVDRLEALVNLLMQERDKS